MGNVDYIEIYKYGWWPHDSVKWNSHHRHVCYACFDRCSNIMTHICSREMLAIITFCYVNNSNKTFKPLLKMPISSQIKGGIKAEPHGCDVLPQNAPIGPMWGKTAFFSPRFRDSLLYYVIPDKTSIKPAWKSKHILAKECDTIAHPCRNLNGLVKALLKFRY